MPSLKVIIIANACEWNSWPDKIAAIKTFYAPLVELEIDIKYTDFQNIPTQTIQGQVTTFGTSGVVDGVGTDIDISTSWLTENISPLAEGYDIVVFQTTTIPPQTGLPLGITIGRLNDAWTCMTFTVGENDIYEIPGSYCVPPQEGMFNYGDQAITIIEHEISHALYEMSGLTDNTHKFFYTGQFSRVLTDIKLPNQSTLVSLYQKVIADLQQELGLIKQSQSTADMNTTTQLAKDASTTFPPMIEKWITAISQGEGARPELNNPGNLKYSTLTASWGATKGPAASDGGNLCQFSTMNAGEIALGNFLTLGCEDQLIAFHAPEARTLAGFTTIYAGNPPQGYIDGIEEALGVPGTTQISTFLS